MSEQVQDYKYNKSGAKLGQKEVKQDIRISLIKSQH